MGKRGNIDKSIRNIMKWADRPEWRDARAEVFDAHLEPVCDLIGIDREELSLELEEHGYDGMLFGIIFEDFISYRFPPDEINFIDDYLKHRSWRENVAGRRYLEQLRASVLSLYEVVDISPGRHCDLVDLVRGGETCRVYEHMGTQNLVKWDRLAARVLNMNGKHVFSGGILPFSQEASQHLLGMLAESRTQFNKEHTEMADKEAVVNTITSKNRDKRFLHDVCPAFTFTWLTQTLERLQTPLPEMVNRDGEALVSTETRFPFLADQQEEITDRLDAAPDWERDNPDEYLWTWFLQSNAIASKPQHSITVDTLQHGQRPFTGALELKPGVLTLTTNSVERAKRGQGELEKLLHGLIGPALSKLQTLEQMMADKESHKRNNRDREPAQPIDPAIAAEVIQNMMDQHYRQCLDEPIPSLGDKSPRQCAKSESGRAQVVEWLKYLENNELRRAASQGQEPYDSSWMWEELKLTSYRHR